MRFILTGAFVACLTLGPGCSSLEWGTGVPERAFLLRAPTQVTLGGRAYTLRAEAWRNFMPGPGGRYSALTFVANLEASQGVDPRVDIAELWVVHGDEVWAPEFADVEPAAARGRIRKVVRGGREWEAGTEFVAVARVIGPDGWQYLVRAPAATVQAVY